MPGVRARRLSILIRRAPSFTSSLPRFKQQQGNDYGPYDRPGLQGELALAILETLPLAAINCTQLRRIKELLVRVDTLEGFRR
jgi:hypothetical protein